MDWWQPLSTEPPCLEEGCAVVSENPEISLDLDRKTLDHFKA